MSHEVVRTIPTNQGRRVEVGLRPDGQLVLVKTAESDEWSEELRAQRRHFEFMREVLGPDAPYPEVLAVARTSVTLRYYQHGSLDELSYGDDLGLVVHLAARALDDVFSIATHPAAGRVSSTDVAGKWVADHARQRSRRLREAMRRSTATEGVATTPEFGRAVDEVVAWTEAPGIDSASRRVAAPQLGLAAHGDFGLNNVLLQEAPSESAPLVFIDTRAMWIDGIPLWDPIMDLATLIAFHCRIEPALARAGEIPPAAATGGARLTEAGIRAQVAASSGFQRWTAQDPSWPLRLELLIAIRLLGNVSVQLTTARSGNLKRASEVLRLCSDHKSTVDAVLGESQ